jgi:hypothetical protein
VSWSRTSRPTGASQLTSLHAGSAARIGRAPSGRSGAWAKITWKSGDRLASAAPGSSSCTARALGQPNLNHGGRERQGQVSPSPPAGKSAQKRESPAARHARAGSMLTKSDQPLGLGPRPVGRCPPTLDRLARLLPVRCKGASEATRERHEERRYYRAGSASGHESAARRR